MTPNDEHSNEHTVPHRWEADVVLYDGSVAVVRPVHPDDVDALKAFYGRVSPESKYLRFFGAHPELEDSDIDAWVNVDMHDAVTLVLLDKEDIVGTARYELVQAFLPERVGDVSFLVQDDHHGNGVANILLEHLAQAGRECGITRFFAEMLPNNRTMVQVFVRAGYELKPQFADGVIEVNFPIAPTDRSWEVMLQREHRSEAAAIRRLLNPRSIAIAGEQSRMQTSADSLAAGGFRGQVHVLTAPGAQASEMLQQLADHGTSVDVAVVSYPEPPDTLDAIMQAAAACQAKGVVVLARGHNPTLTPQEASEFVSHARAHGLRAFGPASLGVINTDAQIQLNTTPAPMPRTGAVSMFTQTAGISTLVLSHAVARGCGVRSFIASGSFADVTANDVMHFWIDDEDTRICLLSLDAIGNPRKFFRVLQRLALDKPVVIFAPSRALNSAKGHGYQLENSPSAHPAIIDDIIGHAGVMVVSRRDAMFDIAQILARQPLPTGPEVVLISNSVGLNAQMVQAAYRFGLVPESRPVTDIDPAGGVVRAAQHAVEEGKTVLAAVVEISEPLFEEVQAGLSELAAHSTAPVVGVFIGFRTPEQLQPQLSPAGLHPEQQGQLPVFPAYAEALEALGAIVRNQSNRATHHASDSEPVVTAHTKQAKKLIEQLIEGTPTATPAQLLDYYGINAHTVVDDIADTYPQPVIIIRTVEDPVLGPMTGLIPREVTFDLTKEETWRVPSRQKTEALSMIADICGQHIHPDAADALADTIVRASVMNDEHAALVDMNLVCDLNQGDVIEASLVCSAEPAYREQLVRNL